MTRTATAWDVMNYRCWCGEDDFESVEEIFAHDRLHARRNEEPGDPYEGARVSMCDNEGVITEIKGDDFYVCWDDDTATVLHGSDPFRVIDPWE